MVKFSFNLHNDNGLIVRILLARRYCSACIFFGGEFQ